MNFGPTEILLVLVVVLVLFGGSRLPKLARSLGSAKKEFEQGIKDGETEAEAKERDTKKAADKAADKAAEKTVKEDEA